MCVACEALIITAGQTISVFEGASVCNIRFWCLRAPVCLCHISKSWWPLFTAVRLLQVITWVLSHMLLVDPLFFLHQCSHIYNTICISKLDCVMFSCNTSRVLSLYCTTMSFRHIISNKSRNRWALALTRWLVSCILGVMGLVVFWFWVFPPSKGCFGDLAW